MPRIPQNQLKIEPVYATGPDGKITDRIQSYRMFGYILGQKIRRAGTDLQALEKERDAHMARVQDRKAMEQLRPVGTFLTVPEVRTCEALIRDYRHLPRPLREYIEAGIGQLGNGARVKISEARDAWEKRMRSPLVKNSDEVISNNLINLKHFLAHSKCEYLDEITGKNINAFLESQKLTRKGTPLKTQTRLTRALRLHAFISFCLEFEYLAKNPFKVDFEGMEALAKRERERPRILSPDQAKALLESTIELCPRMVPHVILATWCFIRDAEVGRLELEDLYLDNRHPSVQLSGKKFGSAMRDVEIPANVLPLLRECIKRGLWAKGTNPYYHEGSFVKIREHAKLIKLSERGHKGYRRVLDEGNCWQAHIMRHSGISYHFNLHRNINETTRQAGNSPATAFTHYLRLPAEGDAEKFYAITAQLKDVPATEPEQAVA